MTLTVTFRLGTDPDKAQQLVQNRVAQAEPRLPEEVRAPRRHHGQELARPDDGRAPALAERPLRHDLSAQLRGAQRQGPAGAHRRRRPGADLRRRRLLDARLARPAEGRRARPVGGRRRARDPRAERAGRRRRGRRLAEPAGPRPAALGQRPGPPRRRGGIRRHRRQDRRRRRSHAAARRRAHRARRLRLRAALAARQQAGGGASPIFQAPGSNAHPDLRQRARHDGRAQDRTCPRAWTTGSSTTRPSSCAPRSRPWCTRCSRPSRWSCSW